jgi:hypothetical protein
MTLIHRPELPPPVGWMTVRLLSAKVLVAFQ